MKNTIRKALERNDIKFQILRDSPFQIIYKMGVNLKHGRVDTFVDIRPELNRVLIYTMIPAIVPENKRMQIAEFITRANYGLMLGNFELDMNDGEVRFKNNFVYDDLTSESDVEFLTNLFISFGIVDKYLPGIMSVIYANVNPLAALGQIENNIDPSLN